MIKNLNIGDIVEYALMYGAISFCKIGIVKDVGYTSHVVDDNLVNAWDIIRKLPDEEAMMWMLENC